MAVLAPGPITSGHFPQQIAIYDKSIGQLLAVASIRPSLSA
jgi:hypothetical protein